MSQLVYCTCCFRLSAVEEEDESEASSSESDSDNLPHLEMSELLKVGMKTKELLPKLIIDEMYVDCI